MWSTVIYIDNITWSFSYGHAQHKEHDDKKYTSFAGHFDGHGDVPVQYGTHHPILKV